MKFTTGAVAFLISASLASARAHGPKAMRACKDSDSIEEFAACFVTNANPACVDDTTLGSLQACYDALDPPPEDVRDFVRNSGCFDSIKVCMMENAPERGERGERGERFGSRIPRPIMEACEDSETIEIFASCFVENADIACIDEGTLTEITTCIDGLETPPEDLRDAIKNSGCFTTVSECMKERFDEFTETLPLCLPQTMGALGMCIRQNKEICQETCDGVTPPMLDVDTDNLSTCADFQAQVVTPLCPTISCCEDCVDEFLDAADCVAAEFLGVEGECDSECPVERRSRELAFERIKKWFGKGGSGGPAGGNGDRPGRPGSFGMCLDILRLESDTDTVTEGDVADFVECLSERFLEAMAREPMEDSPAGGLRG